MFFKRLNGKCQLSMVYKQKTAALVKVFCVLYVLFSYINTCAAGTKVVSDLPILSIRQDWGKCGINVAAHEPSKKPLELKIGDKVYNRGIGTHAKSEIVIDLSGRYKNFDAEVGLQNYEIPNNPGSVIFKVYVDGIKKFESKVKTIESPAESISVPVEGAMEMTLEVDDAGDGINCDLANWARASLELNENPVVRNRTAGLNIVPFGKVMSWDCAINRLHASRIAELSESDIFPGRELRKNDDVYELTPDKNGDSSIGARWAENRRIRKFTIEFAENSNIPEPDHVKLQWWVGESRWIGDWIDLSGKTEKNGNYFEYNCNITDYRNDHLDNAAHWTPGVPKYRWVISSGQPLKVKISKHSLGPDGRIST